jgi:hypothetical protein
MGASYHFAFGDTLKIHTNNEKYNKKISFFSPTLGGSRYWAGQAATNGFDELNVNKTAATTVDPTFILNNAIS